MMPSGSCMALGAPGVIQRVVTPCSWICSQIPARLGVPAGIRTSRPPFSSGAQISKVEASNETAAMCRITVSEPNGT